MFYQKIKTFFINLDISQDNTIKTIFIHAILLWCMLHTVLLFPIFNVIFDPQNITRTYRYLRISEYYSSIILTDIFLKYYFVFIFGQILTGIIYIFFSRKIIFLIFFHFFTININNREPSILDGGNNIIQILLGFSILININTICTKNAFYSSFANSISNLGFLASKIQICLVYFTAGVCKLQGDLWTHGTALFYILQNRDYSHHTLIENLNKIIPLLSLNTYFVILFQISFSFLIWFKETKNIVIMIGILFHLSIAIFMGLPMFALAMILSYFCFFNDQEFYLIKSQVKRYLDPLIKKDFYFK